jgi:phosphatidylglycerol:prolipoprotein diacylglycerol transferase
MDVIEIGLSPILFRIGGFEIRWYGFMMLLGVLTLLFWTYMQIRRGAKLSYDDLLGGALVGTVSGIVFARLLHVFDGIDNIRLYFSDPISIIGGTGLTIYGAILGASLGIWIYCRIHKINYAYAVDVITPGVIMAQIFGRVGCLFNGCCFGHGIADGRFNIMYTNPNSFAPVGVALQPVQVYEILFLLVLLIIILIFRSRFKPSGVQFMFYLGMYSLWRIAIGFMRDGASFAFGLVQAQVIGIIVSIICFGGIFYLVYRDRKTKQQISRD